jgi:hypothetical protein
MVINFRIRRISRDTRKLLRTSTLIIIKTKIQELHWGLFGSVVAVAFQIAFRAKMHANDVFLFFKNYF